MRKLIKNIFVYPGVQCCLIMITVTVSELLLGRNCQLILCTEVLLSLQLVQNKHQYSSARQDSWISLTKKKKTLKTTKSTLGISHVASPLCARLPLRDQRLISGESNRFSLLSTTHAKKSTTVGTPATTAPLNKHDICSIFTR